MAHIFVEQLIQTPVEEQEIEIASLSRPQSTDAHAGKNPVNHVGKIYAYFASHLAQQIATNVSGIREVYVQLCSQIGKPIDAPLATSLKLVLRAGVSLADVQAAAESIVANGLARMNEFTKHTKQLMTEEFYCTWEQNLGCARCT